MTLTSEMTRLAAEFEDGLQDRLAQIAGIQARVGQELEDGQVARARAMAEHSETIDADLKGLFSEAAIIRGRAEDLIDDFAAQREKNAATMRAKLESHVADLQVSVEKLLGSYSSARDSMSAREAAARQAYLKELQARVQALLADAAKFVDGLRKDRERAGRVWARHARNMSKLRRGGDRKPESAEAKSAPTGGANGPAAKKKGADDRAAAPAPKKKSGKV
ncbi:MAG: hypothetical protein MI755_04270 [Sphingomonadales bacterium]|nr:hypothetical protein [Sphingomonadales bacterium]